MRRLFLFCLNATHEIEWLKTQLLTCSSWSEFDTCFVAGYFCLLVADLLFLFIAVLFILFIDHVFFLFVADWA